MPLITPSNALFGQQIRSLSLICTEFVRCLNIRRMRVLASIISYSRNGNPAINQDVGLLLMAKQTNRTCYDIYLAQTLLHINARLVGREEPFEHKRMTSANIKYAIFRVLYDISANIETHNIAGGDAGLVSRAIMHSILNRPSS